MLEEVKQGLEEAARMTTTEGVTLVPERAAEIRASVHARKLEVQKRVQEERNLATALTALLPQQSGTREEKFGGEDFGPSFRREWTETDTGRYPPEFELWEIRRCTPNAIQPDIKNMRTVVEVWEFLEQEYGQLLELTSELVDSFQFSKDAKTEEAKFTELYRSWTMVYSDLEEVGKVSVLDHEPTLAKVAKSFPSHVSQTKYVDMRMEELVSYRTILRNISASGQSIGMVSEL